MITCRDCVEFLADYLEGNLPDEQRQTFEQHLKLCPPCERFLNTYEDTIRMAKHCLCTPTDEMKKQVPEELVQAILKARKQGE